MSRHREWYRELFNTGWDSSAVKSQALISLHRKLQWSFCLYLQSLIIDKDKTIITTLRSINVMTLDKCIRSQAKKAVTSSRPASIHQFTVFRFRFRCSRRFNPGVLITSSQLQSCSRGPVVLFGANAQAVHFVKEYTPWVEHTWKENHKYDHIYTTNESSLVQHIPKMRGQVHNCPLENIWFAISQPLCIM